MKDSIKANLIVFLIIAVIAFCISSAFASLTIHDDYDSYKLMKLENDSFEPVDINYVPTHIPKNNTNTTTNSTINNTTDTTEDVEDTTDTWNETYDEEWDENYEETDKNEWKKEIYQR